MNKKDKRAFKSLPRRICSSALAGIMVIGSVCSQSSAVSAQESLWKSDVETSLDELTDAMSARDGYADAEAALKDAYDSLESSVTVQGLAVTEVGADYIKLEWSAFASDSLAGYNVYWADKNEESTKFLLMDKDSNNASDNTGVTIDITSLDQNELTVSFTVYKPTSKNYYFKVAPITSAGVGSKTAAVMSPTAVSYDAYLEGIGRGLTATMTDSGVYLNWRLLGNEVSGYSDSGLTGVNFNVYRSGTLIATVTDSTNYLDTENTQELTADTYKLVPVAYDTQTEYPDMECTAYDIFTSDSANANTAYRDIPLQVPASTTFRELYGIDEMVLAGYTMTDSGYTSVDEVITYSANDMSVADVDNDGEYEYLVKWDPSYSKDVSQQGYTGKQYIDCYELDGTLLWRLDLGINIRAGAHYTEFGVYDYDGDGKAEMMVKTAPGTKMIKYEIGEDGKNVTNADGSLKVASENYITISDQDQAQGVTNDSNYVFSAAQYRDYLIDIFRDWGVWSMYSEETVKGAIEGHWSGNLVTLFSVSTEYSDSTFYTGKVENKANVTYSLANMTADDIRNYIPDYQEGDKLVNVSVRDESGNLTYVSTDAGVSPVMRTVRVEDVQDYYGSYDLESVDFDATGIGYTEEQAAVLADYFLKHYEYRMKKHNLETFEGYIITGPEYISLFDCSDGSELDTQDWYYGREDDGLLWGDYAMNYIEPGNRVDRFNVAVAYLDGVTPSAIMGRGYYTRTTMVAYNVVDKKLEVVDAIDSGWTVMNNPFNDGPHGYDGNDEENGTLSGQGDHYIAVADVDGDGCQDIVNGGAIVSYKNGKLYLYSSGGDYLNAGTGDTWAKYGHGDAIHITDIDPDRPGLEIVSCFEGGTGAPYDWAMRDAATNEVIFGAPGTTDFGRIIIGDVLTDVRGLEIDTGYDAKGNKVSIAGTSNNMNIKWSANMSTQFVTGALGASNTVPKIIGNVDGKSYTFLTASEYYTNNYTKGNPCLVADLFGDYREEMILRAKDSSHLRIYMNTEVSEHKNYTLMHNLQYRVGVAAQNSCYNQPAYTDYYYASDTDWAYVMAPNQPADQEPGKVEVQPANVTLNITSKTLLAGNTLQLTAAVTPSTASQEVTWSVDDETIAAVDENGVVTAVSKGIAYVTAATVNGRQSTCKISVIGSYDQGGLDDFPVGDTVNYLFGTANQVTKDSIYSKDTGCGFIAPESITLTDGEDYVAGTNYRTGSSTVTYEYPTFVMDVPAGIYEVTIKQGTNGSESAVNGAYVEGNMYSVRWSTESFATGFTEPSESSYIWTGAGEVKETTVETAVADGQLTIELATWLTDDSVSGYTYIKEISITRKEQITAPSSEPTLRFIGDSTLAKYPPDDGGTWTPIPERTGWGEEFSMGRFVDDSVVLVNKAVAGSSLKSYVYDGYYNDFLLNSRPGDTVIIESGINDSAAGRRYSTDAEFEQGLRYLIDSCEAFGLDVIISQGTSSAGNYTAKMASLAAEYDLPYVELLKLWNAYLTGTGSSSGDVTVDGTHLNRVGGVVAAQLVANAIADLDGLYISGHVNAAPINYNAPTATVTGLYAKAQTESSVTLAFSIPEDTLYEYDQLITGFKVYGKEKGSSGDYQLITTQTAYVSAGMNGPKLQATFEAASADYTYYVVCEGLTGEGPASAAVNVAVFDPSVEYTLLTLIEQYETQLYDAAPYTVESYAAVLNAFASAKEVLQGASKGEEDLQAALDQVNAAIAGLTLNAAELVKTDFQQEALVSSPWGASGSNSGLLSCIMEEDGNRMLELYVEAAGSRTVNKTFSGAASVNAAVEEVKFEWYPGQPDTRNCTEVEFYSSDSSRIISLKTSNNGHIGYVVGNYPSNNSYLIGDGFHDYEGSTAVDLGLTNEAWYNVKIVFHFAEGTADLYIVPRDDASLDSAAVKGIEISPSANTVTKLNFRLMRGRTDGDAGNDLSILWDTYLDDFAIYYANNLSNADQAAYKTALAAYETAIAGLGREALSGEEFVLAQAVMAIMPQDVGFFTDADYAYAVSVLTKAAQAAPQAVMTNLVSLSADDTSLTAGLSAAIKARLSVGANEDLIWTSSDESIAAAAGTGTNAVVTAKQAGTVTITAAGASSGVSGSIEITVTGQAYFFGSDVTSSGAYSEEIGYGFYNYTYPEKAKGWVGDVYYARNLSRQSGVSYIGTAESGSDYLAVNGQVWTELPDNSTREEDTITYENTNSFDVDLPNGDYTVSVTFHNPTKTSMNVMVKAEDIRRYDYGDHDTAQIAQAVIGAGQTSTVTFDLALTDEQLTLRFEQNDVASSYDSAATRTVYVKSVSVDEYQSDNRDKTAVYVMGDSTVQTYTNTDTYRTGWGQLLYTLFGTLDADSLYETALGYAYYETEDTIVMNYARDARSAKSFLEEGRLNEVLLGVQEGDYVFLQFAHNDDNSARNNRFLSISDYKTYLEAYNAAIEERGATLVLVTPIVLATWENDELDHRFDDYRLAMMQAAEKNDIPLLDLMGSSLELIDRMGSANVTALGLYMSDIVHTKMPGAKLFTGLLGNLLNANDNGKLESLKALMDAASDGSVAISCDEVLYLLDSAALTVTTADGTEADLYSSDESVVRIVDGSLLAVGVGTAIITAGYTGGDLSGVDCTAYTAYKVVTVTDDARDLALVSVKADNSLAAESGAGSAPVVWARAAAKSAALLTSGITPADGNTGNNVAVYPDVNVAGKQVSPLYAYQYDFGSKNGNAGPPFVTISNQAYTEALGYGFISDISGLNYTSHGDNTIIASGSTEYDLALAAAVSDASRLAEWEFAIDLPAGEYMVSIYAYDAWNSGWSAGAGYYINDVLVGSKTQVNGMVQTVEEAAMSARVVLSEDGRIVIKGVNPNKLAFISAITVNEYVDKVDDYDADAWQLLKDAMAVLKVKTAMFADDSTPFDFDVSLVNKMMAVMDAIDAVRYMNLADTTEGSAVYALAEIAAANKNLYSDGSMEKLIAAMAAYEEVLATLDIKEELTNTYDTLEYWLTGVKTDDIETAYSLYVDFESVQTGSSKYEDLDYLTEGWTSVGAKENYPYYTGYSEETGYGMLAAADGRNRKTGNPLFDDFIMKANFAMDLPAGDYVVTTYFGDLLANCSSDSAYQFFTDYEGLGTDGYGIGTMIGGSTVQVNSGMATYATREFTFTLEEDATVTMVSQGYTMAMTVEQYIPAEVDEIDLADLISLVAEIDGLNLVETDYTISTWTAFEEAYDAAEKGIEAGISFYQQMELVYSNLKNAYEGLVLRTATSEYALDFGPADENGSDPLVWGSAPMLASYDTMNKTTVDLGLGTMLYESNSDDNGMHYGFISETASGYTASGGNYFRDWVYGSGGSAYTFKADLPAGYYYVYVYTGCKESANTTKFYFNDGAAAADSANMAVSKDAEGRTIYTQTSSSGAQFAQPACIYKVKVTESGDTLGYVNGVKLGTFSITLFDDDPSLTADAITARLCGIEICPAEGEDEADKTILGETLAIAKSYDSSLYTEESYAVLAAAITEAEAILADEAATQEEADNMVEELKAAMEGLVSKGDGVNKATLEAAVAAAKSIDGSLYTPESYGVLTEAVTKAEAILANEEATQEEVDNMAAELKTAMEGLVVPGESVDKRTLEETLAMAKNIDGSLYTPESVAVLTAAITKAEGVIANESATQEEVNSMVAQLKAAMEGLAELAPAVPVTGVKGDGASLVSMKVGDTTTLTATVSPANATNKSVVWSVSNTSVAEIDGNGVITAKASGMIVVTVTTVDGGFTGTIILKVSP